jgi:omega-6 fatty acid desaturase (delta-12 desaturase)
MSSVNTFASGSNGASSDSSSVINRSGNIASFQQQGFKTGLTAVDTYGNTFEVPDYTIKDILSAIPKHSYERRLTTSFYYVFRDIFMLVTFGFLANTFIPQIPNTLLRFGAWAGYVYVQGLVCTGIWVLAHECGHQAFSDYGWVNDTVGWVLHSYLLVPYFSWKYSHSKHHKATGHLTRDMVFVPKTKERFLEARNSHSIHDIMEDAPIYTLGQLLFQQLGGWIVYLFANVSGQPHKDVHWFKKSHFHPSTVILDKKDYWFILLSDLGIVLQLFAVYNWYKYFGGFSVLVHWFLPYVLTNHWLVFITFLQHSDPKMAHYEAHQWNFARGAAATIDREFGFIGPFFFHDIIETHVLHHYCSRIPFYNAREASDAIKKVMGKHYMFSDENMWKALWKSGRWCQYVDGKDGVMMYRNVNGFGVDPKTEK